MRGVRRNGLADLLFLFLNRAERDYFFGSPPWWVVWDKRAMADLATTLYKELVHYPNQA